MLRFAWCATQALLMIRAGIKHRQDPSINKSNTHEGYHARFEKLVTHGLNLYQKTGPFQIRTLGNCTKNHHVRKDHAS